ncbi:MAG: hypothetical protein M3P23_04460 [Actinomycetota bacterium]|nr:hypothetical protein [Actinomycetota bacterium]
MAGDETYSASGFEMLAAQAYDDFVITEVIRPAAVLPESAARQVLVEMAFRDVNGGGQWHARPGDWHRYDRPWPSPDDTGGAQLLGTMQVAYGTPTKYEITIYRATITATGTKQGWTVESLCNEALGLGGLTLASCPRADLAPPPRPFHF